MLEAPSTCSQTRLVFADFWTMTEVLPAATKSKQQPVNITQASLLQLCDRNRDKKDGLISNLQKSTGDKNYSQRFFGRSLTQHVLTSTLRSKKCDAKIQITITTAYLIRIKYPLSGFNYHLADVNVANFNKIFLSRWLRCTADDTS